MQRNVRTLSRTPRRRSSSGLSASSWVSATSGTSSSSSSRSGQAAAAAVEDRPPTVSDLYLTEDAETKLQANLPPSATDIYDILNSALVGKAMAKYAAQKDLAAMCDIWLVPTGRKHLDVLRAALKTWMRAPPMQHIVKWARQYLDLLLSIRHVTQAEHTGLVLLIENLATFSKRVLATLYLSYTSFLLRRAEVYRRSDLDDMRRTQAAMLALRDQQMFDRADLPNVNNALSRLILQRLE